MSALPTVTQYAEQLAAYRKASTPLELRMAESVVLLSYVRAAARAEGVDESRALVAAFELLRERDGEDAAVDALARVGVDAYAVLDDVEAEDAAEAERQDLERHVDRYPWGTP